MKIMNSELLQSRAHLEGIYYELGAESEDNRDRLHRSESSSNLTANAHHQQYEANQARQARLRQTNAECEGFKKVTTGSTKPMENMRWVGEVDEASTMIQWEAPCGTVRRLIPRLQKPCWMPNGIFSETGAT